MSARQQAFKDITAEPMEITYNELGMPEIWTVRVSHIVQGIFDNFDVVV